MKVTGQAEEARFARVVRRAIRKSGLLLSSLLFSSMPVASTAVLMPALLSTALAAQTYDNDGDRKVISRVDPEYPDALKKLYIGGVVRVEVVVAPSGTVRSTKLLGGSPILGQSTMKAIKQWKYAPAASEQTLTVKVDFDPHR